jgi:hypothetical protein
MATLEHADHIHGNLDTCHGSPRHQLRRARQGSAVSKTNFEKTGVRFRRQELESPLVNRRRLRGHHTEEQSAQETLRMGGLTCDEFRTAQAAFPLSAEQS